MESFLRTFFDQTINGLVIGNIYALTAVGLALIFGVGNLINFAHGSVYMVGAYVGWVCRHPLASAVGDGLCRRRCCLRCVGDAD